MTTSLFLQAVRDRLAPWRVTDDRAVMDDLSWRPPWVVLDFPPMWPVTDRWEGPADDRRAGVFQTTCVATSAATARDLHDRVVPLLADWQPQVPGWMVHPVLADWQPRALTPYTGIPDRVLHQVAAGWTWHAYRTH